jgi:hypothetical protein
MNQIDDGFIAEAANPEILLMSQRKRRRMRLIKRVSSIAACTLVAVSVVFAIPMIRLMSNVEADKSDSMNAEIGDEISEQLSAMTPADSFKDEEESIREVAAEKAEPTAAQAESAEMAASATKAASEAAEKAASAAKAASEAAEKAASQLASSIAAASNKTTTVAIESESDPVPECERIGQIDFYYSDHVLFSLSADANYRLTSLVIPSELGGEQITELAVDFWRFCDSNPNLKQVTIHDTVTSFGDVSYLNEKMEIICKQGSAADIFFSAKGYTVKYS